MKLEKKTPQVPDIMNLPKPRPGKGGGRKAGLLALVAVLAVALAVSLFNPLLCVLATVANPVIGLLYTFFFSNTIGKNLTRAVLSAALLCILFYGMDYYGFSVISIQTDALLKYSPFALALLGVWYVYDSAL